jgi:hypothetical protein
MPLEWLNLELIWISQVSGIIFVLKINFYNYFSIFSISWIAQQIKKSSGSDLQKFPRLRLPYSWTAGLFQLSAGALLQHHRPKGYLPSNFSRPQDILWCRLYRAPTQSVYTPIHQMTTQRPGFYTAQVKTIRPIDPTADRVSSSHDDQHRRVQQPGGGAIARTHQTPAHGSIALLQVALYVPAMMENVVSWSFPKPRTATEQTMAPGRHTTYRAIPAHPALESQGEGATTIAAKPPESQSRTRQRFRPKSGLRRHIYFLTGPLSLSLRIALAHGAGVLLLIDWGEPRLYSPKARSDPNHPERFTEHIPRNQGTDARISERDRVCSGLFARKKKTCQVGPKR